MRRSTRRIYSNNIYNNNNNNNSTNSSSSKINKINKIQTRHKINHNLCINLNSYIVISNPSGHNNNNNSTSSRRYNSTGNSSMCKRINNNRDNSRECNSISSSRWCNSSRGSRRRGHNRGIVVPYPIGSGCIQSRVIIIILAIKITYNNSRTTTVRRISPRSQSNITTNHNNYNSNNPNNNNTTNSTPSNNRPNNNQFNRNTYSPGSNHNIIRRKNLIMKSSSNRSSMRSRCNSHIIQYPL